MDNTGKLSVSGHIDVPLNEVAEFEVLLADHIRLTREEPGCLVFEIVPISKFPGRYSVTEHFVDRAAFEVHTQRTRNSPWWSKTQHIPRHLTISDT